MHSNTEQGGWQGTQIPIYSMSNKTPRRAIPKRSSTDGNKRKIIQISSAGHKNTSNTQSNMTVFALCDDGTVWANPNGSRDWERLPDIPQY